MDRASRIWIWLTVFGSAFLLFLIAIAVWFVDPYFIFRSPRTARFRYVLDNCRCQNPGIMKNFDFDMMVIGSSMTENFKASEFSAAFGLRCAKLPYTGGSYREYREAVQYANAVNANLQLTIVCLDFNKLLLPADWLPGTASPGLAFSRSLNPVKKLEYLFYPDAVAKTFTALTGGEPPGITSFDDYRYWWREDKPRGKEVVLGGRRYEPITSVPKPYSEEDSRNVEESIRKNILPMIACSRRIIFFFSPYCALERYLWRHAGDEERFRAAERQYVDEILKHPNARIFSWNDRVSLVGNLDNYVDSGHYVASVNADMVKWMRDGVGEITAATRDDYFRREERLVNEFDYETLFK